MEFGGDTDQVPFFVFVDMTPSQRATCQGRGSCPLSFQCDQPSLTLVSKWQLVPRPGRAGLIVSSGPGGLRAQPQPFEPVSLPLIASSNKSLFSALYVHAVDSVSKLP